MKKKLKFRAAVCVISNKVSGLLHWYWYLFQYRVGEKWIELWLARKLICRYFGHNWQRMYKLKNGDMIKTNDICCVRCWAENDRKSNFRILRNIISAIKTILRDRKYMKQYGHRFWNYTCLVCWGWWK